MTKKRKAAKSARRGAAPKRPKAARTARRSSKTLLSVATDETKSYEQRATALAEDPIVLYENEENLQTILNVLRDRAQPVQLRLDALQSLQAASFSVLAFGPARGEYLTALRSVVDDPDPEMRQRVLGILARERDGFAQKKLLEGLHDPAKALVPPEKALQLLSYDVHAEVYPVAREIVSKPPNTAAKREALRILAADANAAPIFEKVLRDKGETPEIRQISAAALHAVNPKKLQEHAREIVMDSSEPDDIQATSLTALTQFGDKEKVAKDRNLLKRVDKLKGQASKSVSQSARQFIDKYGE
jgi:hypothetical protein